MVETFEFLIRQLADHPRHGRAALYREMLRSETFLLTIDKPLPERQATRVSQADETLPVWADKDAEMGGVWVPVFPSRDSVADYVNRRKLKAPAGQEFLWMGHEPGTVFPLLRGVPCFAGVRLYLDQSATVDLTWSEVKALSEKRIPPETPEIYDMPIAKLQLPSGLKLAFGALAIGPAKPKSKMLCLPQAGKFKPEDVRKLVRLPLPDGPVVMACRHFLQVLRYVSGKEEGGERYVEDMLCSLIGFQMYGEAEALCEWIVSRGGEVYGWIALAAILGRTGRLEECAELCKKGAAKYPAEKAFALNGAKALSRLERVDEARALVEEALLRFPDDKRLCQARADLPSA